MAVYKRGYKPYTGASTSAIQRILVIPRYAFETLFDSRMLMSYFVLCFMPFLVCAAIIYLFNNPLAQTLIGMKGDATNFPFRIDGKFFFGLMNVQGSMAFLLTAWVGPTLIAPDLTNNALPLFLSRPFTKTEYVIGKISVLFILISGFTWLPDTLLYFLQGSLAGNGWLTSNARILYGIYGGSLVWMSILSLLALAISAWVKWRIVASGLLVGVFFVTAGFGLAVNAVLRTFWGNMFNISYLISLVTHDMFDIPMVRNMSRGRMALEVAEEIPTGYAWLGLFAVCAISVMILNKRLRAREVVR